MNLSIPQLKEICRMVFFFLLFAEKLAKARRSYGIDRWMMNVDVAGNASRTKSRIRQQFVAISNEVKLSFIWFQSLVRDTCASCSSHSATTRRVIATFLALCGVCDCHMRCLNRRMAAFANSSCTVLLLQIRACVCLSCGSLMRAFPIHHDNLSFVVLQLICRSFELLLLPCYYCSFIIF